MTLRQLICRTLALSLLPMGSVTQAVWEVNGGVRTQAIFSDNICAVPRNTEAEAIAAVTPRVHLKRDGRRVKMNVMAAVEANSLDYDEIGCSSDSIRGLPYGRDSVVPRLNANGSAILVKDFLYFDTRAYAYQTSIDPFNPATGGSNLNGTGNRSTLFSYSASPYIQRKLGDLAFVSLRYTWDEQKNRARLIGDSSSEKVDFRLGTDNRGKRFGATVVGRYEKVEYDRQANALSRDNELGSAELILTWQLSAPLQLIATGGKSFNDFISQRDDIDGTYWSAGFRWSPQARTSLELTGGERFFGSAYTFNFNHRMKQGVLAINYNRNISFSRDLRGTPGFGGVVDALGRPIDPATGLLLPVDGTPTTITNSPVLNESANIRYSIEGRRSTLMFGLGMSDQEHFIDNGHTRYYNGTIGFTRRMSRKTAFNMTLNWRDHQRLLDGNQQPLSAPLDQAYWTYSMGLSRSFGTRLSADVDYVYTRREGKDDSFDYDENRVILGFNYQF